MKIRLQKRREAEARQAAYNKLSIDQKLTRARARRGSSAREISRLEAQKSA